MKRTCDRLPIFSVSIWKNTAVFAWRGFLVNGRWKRQYSMFDLLHIWTITQYLTFFTAMSTEPSQAPSILMKPTKLAPLSTIAMFILNKNLIRTTTVQCNEMVHLWSVKGGYEPKHKCTGKEIFSPNLEPFRFLGPATWSIGTFFNKGLREGHSAYLDLHLLSGFDGKIKDCHRTNSPHLSACWEWRLY